MTTKRLCTFVLAVVVMACSAWELRGDDAYYWVRALQLNVEGGELPDRLSPANYRTAQHYDPRVVLDGDGEAYVRCEQYSHLERMESPLPGARPVALHRASGKHACNRRSVTGIDGTKPGKQWNHSAMAIRASPNQARRFRPAPCEVADANFGVTFEDDGLRTARRADAAGIAVMAEKGKLVSF